MSKGHRLDGLATDDGPARSIGSRAASPKQGTKPHQANQVRRRAAVGIDVPERLTSAAKGPVEAARWVGDVAVWYKAYRVEVWRYLYRRCLDPELANDLTQDTFLRAATGRYTDQGKPRAWLFTIAARLVADHRKRAETTRTQVTDLSSWEEAIPLWRSSERTPEQSALDATGRRQLRVALVEALARLRPSERQAVLLRFVAGLPLHQTTAETGRTTTAVVQATTRGLRRLRADHRLATRLGKATTPAAAQRWTTS